MSLARIAPVATRGRGASLPWGYDDDVTTATHATIARATRRHAFTVRALAVIDVMIGVVSVLAGLVALFAPPPSVLREVQVPFLIWVWAVLLIVGGSSLAFGRVVDRWVFQTSGIAAMIPGAFIYFVVLLTGFRIDLGVLVACGVILIAVLLLYRRYLELQEFTSSPPTSGVEVTVTARLRHILTLPGQDR